MYSCLHISLYPVSTIYPIFTTLIEMIFYLNLLLYYKHNSYYSTFTNTFIGYYILGCRCTLISILEWENFRYTGLSDSFPRRSKWKSKVSGFYLELDIYFVSVISLLWWISLCIVLHALVVFLQAWVPVVKLLDSKL